MKREESASSYRLSWTMVLPMKDGRSSVLLVFHEPPKLGGGVSDPRTPISDRMRVDRGGMMKLADGPAVISSTASSGSECTLFVSDVCAGRPEAGYKPGLEASIVIPPGQHLCAKCGDTNGDCNVTWSGFLLK